MVLFSQNSIEPSGGRVLRRWQLLAAAWLGLFLVMAAPRLAFSQVTAADREAQIKAAYLYKFISYIQWPDNAFANPKSKLVIGAFGQDPVHGYLRLIAEQRTAGDRPLEFRLITNLEQAKGCHILFFPDAVPIETTAETIRNVRGLPILLVGEKSGFVESGGVISFVIIGNNVRLRMSMNAAAGQGLKISSQLAKIAEVVN